MESAKPRKSISVFGAFALSVGTAIGWGSFVVTGSSFLHKAGPAGSIIGLVIGMFIVMVVAYNYHYLMNKYPNTNGGIFSFAKHTLGGDHAFLVSWFMIITYAAILWANVSSIGLFSRYIFGSTFQFGFHYTIGGYDVWLGETLLSLFFLFLFGGICLLNKKVTTRVQFGMVSLFVALILGGYLVGAIMHQGGIQTYKPDFAPDGTSEFNQIVGVVSMTPWAFIGFESVSHSSRDFSFKHRNAFKVFLVALIVTTALYIAICQLSISVFPDGYANWYEYLSDSGSLSGLDGIPLFYVMHRYLGTAGLVLFTIALLAIILTSIIGNIYGLSNIISTMAKNSVMPKFLAKEDKNGNPRNAIVLILCLTAVMLFFGRVLIGWIVDVNTFCGCIIYLYVCAIALVQARKDANKRNTVFGVIGLALGLLFAVSILANSAVRSDFLEKESILVFVVWATIGFAYYAWMLHKDKAHFLGHSMIALFGLFVIDLYALGSWLFKLVRENSDASSILGGIAASALLLLLAQICFFHAFSVIRKREVETQNQLVLGMATMVEGRDDSTGGHIRRTSNTVRILVEEMKRDEFFALSSEFCRDIIKAAPMHDLGKITIDDAILRKPGKFTEEEYAIMKSHAAEGARIVRQILEGNSDAEFLEVATNVAHYHHERYDGSGYPNGLKGEEIPLEARIMAIADVYDALVSKRVYKEEFSFEKANEIILKGMGTQFDPALEKFYLKARPRIEEYYLSVAKNAEK